ncbi:MAG: DUF47 family protein [Chloroflexota bacterium]|nr:DUF47 family protein [Chloroflexota bacterium]
MGLRDFFKPRQDKFLQLIIEQAAKTLEGMEALEDFMKEPSGEAAKQVRKAEKEADELRRILIDELNRTFVTPIDREDIFALSRAVDDVIDYAHSTVEEMTILGVHPTPYLRRMVSLLGDAATEIHMATLRLKGHPGVASEHAMRAKALENRVEAVYREALADLFNGPEDVHHVMQMLKLREIYRHLSNCADRGDEAANIISDIVVKMT